MQLLVPPAIFIGKLLSLRLGINCTGLRLCTGLRSPNDTIVFLLSINCGMRLRFRFFSVAPQHDLLRHWRVSQFTRNSSRNTFKIFVFIVLLSTLIGAHRVNDTSTPMHSTYFCVFIEIITDVEII